MTPTRHCGRRHWRRLAGRPDEAVAGNQLRAGRSGSVAEWSIAPVLKTGKGQPFVSSNLTASAIPSRCGIAEPSKLS